MMYDMKLNDKLPDVKLEIKADSDGYNQSQCCSGIIREDRMVMFHMSMTLAG